MTSVVLFDVGVIDGMAIMSEKYSGFNKAVQDSLEWYASK